MRQWLDRMGIERGGKTYRAFRDQAARISACRLTFAFKKHGREGFIRHSIVDGGLSLFDIAVDGRQGQLWRETVLLGEKFFQSLKKHPVPLWDGAVSRLANQSLGIDIYCWLAYRLHTLGQTSTIAWPALYAQFGASYAHLHHFKPQFLESLKTVLIVYPDAKVVLSDDRGLIFLLRFRLFKTGVISADARAKVHTIEPVTPDRLRNDSWAPRRYQAIVWPTAERAHQGVL